jgi:hypothetical protein
LLHCHGEAPSSGSLAGMTHGALLLKTLMSSLMVVLSMVWLAVAVADVLGEVHGEAGRVEYFCFYFKNFLLFTVFTKSACKWRYFQGWIYVIFFKKGL